VGILLLLSTAASVFLPKYWSTVQFQVNTVSIKK